ncbi:MAG: hypothetical protein MRY78_07755 [Saprospiraceae bacterium]|nr:hypothetical protein [Saprospiraceae bacterium]
MRYIFFIALGLALWSCQPTTPQTASEAEQTAKAIPAAQKQKGEPNQLDKYWYQGKAEISRYALSQNRYKDVHPGEAVLIFVTEDFLTDKQVKNDRYQNPNSVSVLKNNRVRTFPTGIYTYNIMTSVFTPVNSEEYTETMKITNSSQEWCGQTFMQLNRRDGEYDVLLRSYFEAEGDQRNKKPLALLEDDLFNRIRINPDRLPTGELQMYPSMMIARLLHLDFQPLSVNAKVIDYTGSEIKGEGLKAYEITYPQLKRTLQIVYNPAPPYTIEGWLDTYPSVFDKKPRTTVAQRTETVMSPYWQQNALEDMDKRLEVGID